MPESKQAGQGWSELREYVGSAIGILAILSPFVAAYVSKEDMAKWMYGILGVVALVGVGLLCLCIRALWRRYWPSAAAGGGTYARRVLAILEGEWEHWYQFPGQQRACELARIDSSGRYFVETPRHGYTLDGPHKYNLRDMTFDPETKTITLIKVKEKGEETKYETLTVLDRDHLIGHNTYDPAHTKEYVRTTHDMEVIRRRRSQGD